MSVSANPPPRRNSTLNDPRSTGTADRSVLNDPRSTRSGGQNGPNDPRSTGSRPR